MNHVGRDDVCEALVYHEIARVRKDGGMQTRNVARQIVKALPGRSARGIDVDAVQLFQNIEMIGNFKVGDLRFAEAL